jgi:hypothetical protein
MKNISEQDFEAIKIWLSTKIVPLGYTEYELANIIRQYIDYVDYCIWEPLYILEEEQRKFIK